MVCSFLQYSKVIRWYIHIYIPFNVIFYKNYFFIRHYFFLIFIPNLNFLLDSSSSPSGTEDALGEDSELRVARKAGNLGGGSVGGGARSCQSSQLLAESSLTNSGSGVHSGRS